MELPELEERLGPFFRDKSGDAGATVSDVYAMPGHAGFSYGFTAHTADGDSSWYMRLPPPNTKWKGTADVLRQVQALDALEGTEVPHCAVEWSGDDLQWFERPYFVVPKLDGDTYREGESEWVHALSAGTREHMARQAMRALAGIHRVDWEEKAAGLGPPVPFEADVVHWDRFYERAAEPEMLADAPKVREALLGTMPKDPHIGLFHGDFQWSNLLFDRGGTLLAVIDWELVGIGATLNDVGWIATFGDSEAWAGARALSGTMPGAEALIAMYADYWGEPPGDVSWYRALAAYKFAIITGFNLYLHRSGKRVDPLWETTGPSAKTLIDRAMDLLG